MANSDISNTSTPQQEAHQQEKPEPLVTETPETKAPEFVEAETEPLPTPPPAEPAVNPEAEQPAENAEFGSGSVICAQPISIVAPGGSSSRKKTMDPVEMAKRPAWLPDDWRMETRQRINGITAGLIDRYYFEPSGKHRFRSKIEVVTFIDQQNGKSGSDAGPSETPGSSKKKRKAKAKTDDGASGSETKKKRKYTRKDKKSAAPENAGDVPAEVGELKVEDYVADGAVVGTGGRPYGMSADAVITIQQPDGVQAGGEGDDLIVMQAGGEGDDLIDMQAGGEGDDLIDMQAGGEINVDQAAGVEAEGGGES